MGNSYRIATVAKHFGVHAAAIRRVALRLHLGTLTPNGRVFTTDEVHQIQAYRQRPEAQVGRQFAAKRAARTSSVDLADVPLPHPDVSSPG